MKISETGVLLAQIAFGLIMTAFTIAFGAAMLVACSEIFRKRVTSLAERNNTFTHIATLTLVSTWLVTSMLLVILVWALLLFALGLFQGFETALYFSMISFSTVGYGEVVPPEEWRLLAAFVAVDGFVLFGLNTAFLFEVLRLMREPPAFR